MGLAETIALLPEKPGVYQYYDKQGKLLYVGKAINLKKRVASYFVERKDRDPKTAMLVTQIASLSTIVTTSEAEALLLEDSLIKKHQPPYNIDLKDNKNYPYFRLALNEKYPRLTIVRKRAKDGAKYFGPYPGSLRDTLKTINQLFKLCKCKKPMQKKCLYQQLGQCLAPCQNNIAELYAKEVEKVSTFLDGGYEKLIDQLTKEMQILSKELNFEEAAQIRDKLKTLERIASKQAVIAPDKIRRDIWYFTHNERLAVGTVIVMEFGRIISVQSFYGKIFATITDNGSTKNGEAIVEWSAGLYRDERERLLANYYNEHERPTEIILPEDYRSGFRYELLQIARRNALKALQDRMLEELSDRSPAKGLQRLQEILNLDKLPERIDCFDISHIQGSETVASMSVFRNGLPDKNSYRRYILTQTSPDDFASMQEVLSRRYLKVATGETERPDFILIDGGKGQLAIASRVLATLNLSLPHISLAKEQEEIFFPGRKNALSLKRADPGLRILQQLRDEAHRFAVSFHRLRRKKRMLQ